jgi:hypothetical protein
LALFAENITTQVIVWALLTGFILMSLFLLWHFLLNHKTGASFSSYGLTWNGLVKTFSLAQLFLPATAVLLFGFIPATLLTP